MNIKFGNGQTEFGPGVQINLTGDEIAQAVSDYVRSKGVDVNGPRTIRVNGELCKQGEIYVDPSGYVVYNDQRWYGRGPVQPEGLKKFDELTDAERALRSLIFAIETKDKHNKHHPFPMGGAFLDHQLAAAKETAATLKIPLVVVDANEYH
jgi:hypothetical protein